MQFLLFPPPLEDEWIGSWLIRLAEANLLPVKRVLALLGISSPELVPDQAVLQRLAEATYLTSERIAPMVFLPEQALSTIGSSRTSGSRPFLGVQFLQLCSGCLATDPVPYVRKTWLMATSVTCMAALFSTGVLTVSVTCKSSGRTDRNCRKRNF